jgi:hypothetical protein
MPGDSGNSGRAWIVQALLDHGYVESFDEAFERFIGCGGSAYLPRF